MRPEPGRQLVDVARDLESRHVRRRRRSRSGKRGRVTPRHEEREPRPLESVLETGHPPLDALPGRARSGSSADGQAESGRRGVDVVGPYRPADQVALARVEDSAAEVVASRDVLVDDCDQLEIGVAERDDPVGRAPCGMTASGYGLEAVGGRQSGRIGTPHRSRENDVIELHRAGEPAVRSPG